MAPLHHLEWLFDRDLYVYAKLKPPIWQKALGRVFFHKIAVWLVITALVSLLLLRKRPRRVFPWLLPPVLLFLAYPLMFVVWHGDAMEIARHALGLSLQARIGIFLFLGLCLELFFNGIESPEKTVA